MCKHSAMASKQEFSLPLYEKVARKNTIQRALDLTLCFLLVSLLLYRLLSLHNHGFVWLLAFLCESCFTFNWVLVVNAKWNPVDFKMYPENLEKRFPELPPVDMFVTTADPVLEPPIITVNTILSLLAVDYPTDKLACYLSDDGGSPLTFYSLVEASKFAKLWVPFCKKYKVQVRAPFRYFLDDPTAGANSEFKQDWKKMKAEYEHLCLKIEAASRKSPPCDLTGEFAVFSNVERNNHQTIIKIIGERKHNFSDDDVPFVVYISREKRPKHPHHYKAGAMNVLSRVSGLMTNAPFMLNVDCDMFANNPQVVRQAMCQLLDSKGEREIAFVQYPQCFYDGPRDDPYGNQLVVLMEYMGRGLAGIQGPCYSGTGCFHRRKVIYGQWPEDAANQGNHTLINGKLADNKLLIKEFGNSKQSSDSAAYALKGKKGSFQNNLSSSLEAAFEVAGCDYEFGTIWGKKVGWIYGSMTEDVLTGLVVHKKGWKSTLPKPNPPAFLGCAPSGGPAAMTQQKRWATGLLEILVSKDSPIFGFLTGKLQFRMLLVYLWLLSWAPYSIPELCYAALPAYCIIANSHFLPKVQDPAMLLPLTIFVVYNLLTLREYLKAGMSIRAWWNFMKMGRITKTSAYLFATLTVILKLLGLSETVFEVTQKDQSSDGDDDQANGATKFTFDESPMFVPGTTLLLIHVTALLILSLRLRPLADDLEHGLGLGEVLCCLWLVLCFLPFLKGLFRSGKYGIPKSTIFKSTSLALAFVYLCGVGLHGDKS